MGNQNYKVPSSRTNQSKPKFSLVLKKLYESKKRVPLQRTFSTGYSNSSNTKNTKKVTVPSSKYNTRRDNNSVQAQTINLFNGINKHESRTSTELVQTLDEVQHIRASHPILVISLFNNSP